MSLPLALACNLPKTSSMRKNARHFNARFPAFAMAAVFFFATVASSFSICPCGITCDPDEPVALASAEADHNHSCCGPSEESVTFDTPEPADGLCPCSEQMAASAPELPEMVASQPRLDVAEACSILLRSAPSSFDFSTSALEANFAAPTRGSPLPRPPAHLLHSAFLI